MNWCGKNSFGIGTRPLQTEMRHRRACLTWACTWPPPVSAPTSHGRAILPLTCTVIARLLT